MNSSNGPAGLWIGYQVLAAIALTALCLLAVYLRTPDERRPQARVKQNIRSARGKDGRGRQATTPPKSGLITGYDGRRSTSKTITFAWTFAVAWMLITTAFVAAASGASFSDLLKNTSNLYLVLLGGPYAAAILAKVSVSNGVQTGRIQKTAAITTGAADIVNNDSGSTDLYDFQYTLFNLVAILIVIFLFGAHPGKGFPGIPDFLAILTGGSALTYTVNKGVTSNAPSISDVQPRTARVGDTVEITGTNLLPAAAADARPVVSIGGAQAQVTMPPQPASAGAGQAQVTPPGAPDTIDFTVPAPTTGAWPPQTAQQVAVTTTASVIATSNGALTIVGDHLLITHVTPPRFSPGGQPTVFGSFLLAPGTSAGSANAAEDSVGGLSGNISIENSAITLPIQFVGAYSSTAIKVAVGSWPEGQPPLDTATPATLTLSRAGQQASAPVTIAPAQATTTQAPTTPEAPG